MPHPLFERHAATLERALHRDRRARLLESLFRVAEPEGLRRGRGRGRQGGVRRAPRTSRSRSTSRAPSARVGREVSPFGIPLGITYPKADLDALFAAIGAAQREWRKAGPEAWVGVCAGDPAPDQPAELPLRQRRDAHDRPGVHDGVPGGRAARAGPRARSRRLRVGRDEEDSGQGALGEAAGQERAAAGWRSISGSCRAASAS